MILGLLMVSAITADDLVRREEPSSDAVASVAPEVELLVARTKPMGWEMKRACLYYAFAGQHLLERQGIAASLWVGAVVFAPATIAAHPISPHAWLETSTDFIDFSTLPRWGEVTVIPHELVASERSEVKPGATGVLVLRTPENPRLLGYLTAHRARFERLVRHWEGR
ncbi:MAG: lasso peptide biosynthesis protein [Chromatiaceae bacterium]